MICKNVGDLRLILNNGYIDSVDENTPLYVTYSDDVESGTVEVEFCHHDDGSQYLEIVGSADDV